MSEENTIWLHEHGQPQDTGLYKKDLDEEDLADLERLQEEKHLAYSIPKERLLITTKDHVGSFHLRGAGKRINITPKIFKKDIDPSITNEFFNFADHGTLDYFDGENYVEFGDKNFLVDRLHYDLVNKYAALEREGLLKSYVVHAENSSSMRGKLLMAHQMLNDAMLRPRLFCEFDELEYDSTENRVILQALTIVERTSESSERRMQAMDFAQRLSGVVQKVVVSAPERQRMMRSYNRQTYRYEGIHKTCEQIILDAGIEDIYSGDVTWVAPKLYDMDREFERFVEELFDKYGAGLGDIRLQEREKSWQGIEASDREMKPDITIWDGDVCKEIIDVKYKEKIAASDLYQLGFYMHEYGKHDKNKIERSFIIAPMFGTDDGMVVDDARYKATKSEKMVNVKRLNVKKCLELVRNGDTSTLKAEVRRLVQP